MNWNLNSLTKDNFAHNSMFNYDLISVCETNLDDTVDLLETLPTTIHLKQPIILWTENMEELASSIKILFQLIFVAICILGSR